MGDVLFTSSNTVFIILQSFLVWSGVNYGFTLIIAKCMHEFESAHFQSHFSHLFLLQFFTQNSIPSKNVMFSLAK